MAASIGIKIANGEFYPILDEGSTVTKRLILTTVHDNQKSVQIDVYKSEARSMSDAEYIGSLVIENIQPKPKGEPSIEMVIRSTPEKELIAEAVDLDAPHDSGKHELTVSLQTLEQQETYELPDFEIETHETPPQGLYEKASAIRETEATKNRFPWITVLIIALVLLAVLLVVLLIVKPGKPAVNGKVQAPSVEKTQPQSEQKSTTQDSAATPPAPATALPEPAATAQPAAEESSPPTVIVEVSPTKPAESVPAKRMRPPAPVSSFKIPTTIPKEGFPYKIRWGDTLWDISEAFYRNPWLYPRIAKFNKIRNPDLIISGTVIKIPPKP
ncbi:MAG: Hsp70 family protein [Termitinemataceae bacterium]